MSVCVFVRVIQFIFRLNYCLFFKYSCVRCFKYSTQMKSFKFTKTVLANMYHAVYNNFSKI